MYGHASALGARAPPPSVGEERAPRPSRSRRPPALDVHDGGAAGGRPRSVLAARVVRVPTERSDRPAAGPAASLEATAAGRGGGAPPRAGRRRRAPAGHPPGGPRPRPAPPPPALPLHLPRPPP